MKALKKTLARVAGIGLLAGTSMLSHAAFAAEPIKIGAINPFSGGLALYGTEMTRGFDLAVDQINAAGGLLGRKVVLIRGDAANPQQGIATVEQLAVKEKVDLFVGTYTSAVSNASSDAAMRYNKLYWETNALVDSLTERGLPNFIRTGPNGSNFAAGTVDTVRDVIAPALKKDMKDITVWIEHEDSIFGTSVANEQKRLLEGLGVKVVGMGAHSARAIDITDMVLRAKQAHPDVVIETGYVPDGSLLLRTIRDQGFKPPALVLVGTGNEPETLAAVGAPTLEGMLVVAYPLTNVAESYAHGAAAYLDAYRTKYKAEPTLPQSINAYVGMQMLFDAIKIAGSTDVEKVRAAAATMDKPLGSYATGYGVKFDKNFQNIRALITTVQWQGGKPVTVFPKKAIAPGDGLKTLARN